MGEMMAKALSALFAGGQKAQELLCELGSVAAERYVTRQRIEDISTPAGGAPVFRWSIHFHSYQDMKKFNELIVAAVNGASGDE